MPGYSKTQLIVGGLNPQGNLNNCLSREIGHFRDIVGMSAEQGGK